MAPFVIFLRSFYLSTQFGRYQFEVYDLDPSSSKIIDGIWDIITSVVFTVVLFIVILTSGLVYFDLLDSRVWPLLILIAWVPTVTFFVSGQSAISRIITRAKWNILDDIQAKVEALYSNEDRSIGTSPEERIPTPDTLDHLIKLMDYHDRIKNTPNSALNIRAGLTFINSLLLPVIASVIANTNALIGVFQ